MDSTALQQAVTNIWMTNYATLIILTVVGYDYILTFSDEVEHIWNKPWTRVSTLFFLVRYFGLCCAVIDSISVGAFIQYFQYFIEGHSEGRIVEVVGLWTFFIFIAAADLTMMLRVWALYGRSRFILRTLTTLYAMENISNLVLCIIFSTPKKPKAHHHIETTAKVLGFSYCVQPSGPLILPKVVGSIQVTLGAFMCLLVVVLFIKEALQMYRVTKHPTLSRYMNLLVREGMIYFLVILTYALFDMILIRMVSTNGWTGMIRSTAETIPAFTLVPRFILNLRKLYAYDLQGRCGSEIDTGFGLTSAPPTGGAIVFADAEEVREKEQSEEIEMEERMGDS